MEGSCEVPPLRQTLARYPLFSHLLAVCKIAALLHLLEANRTDIGPPTSCCLLEEPLIMPNLSRPGAPPARVPREKSA
jgi:hypothetical protein